MKSFIHSRKLHILFFQALASFILTYGICTSSQHVAPDIALTAALFLGISLSGQITGGYINPIITIGTFVDNGHKKLGQYLLAQFIGALLGVFWSWLLLGNTESAYTDGWNSIELPKFVLNQLIGSILFTISVLTLTNKLTTFALKSWQIYMSIPIALFLIRKLTGCTLLNPAVGFCLQITSAIKLNDPLIFFRDVWPVIIPSVCGAIIGGFVMKKIYQPLLLYTRYQSLIEDIQKQK